MTNISFKNVTQSSRFNGTVDFSAGSSTKEARGKRGFSSTEIGMPTPRIKAPQPCSDKKTTSDAQPSAMHAVCSSVEKCYKV